MSIKEIYEREDGKHIRLYKRGVFWTAYEQSALSLCAVKPLKINQRQVRGLGSVVWSVGFPEGVMRVFVEAYGPFVFEGDSQGYFITEQRPAEYFESLRTRFAPPAQSAGNQLSGVPADDDPLVLVGARLRAFRLAERTPMDAMHLVQELQSIMDSQNI